MIGTIVRSLWYTTARARIGTLSFIVSLLGYSAIILGWLAGVVSLLPPLAIDVLTVVFSGLFAIGPTLVFYEVCRRFLRRKALLISPESPTEEESNEVVPDDAPPTPNSYNPPRSPDVSGDPIQGIMLYLPTLPLLWVAIQLQDLLPAIQSEPPSGLVEIGSFIGVMCIMIVIHELVHAGVMKCFGHSISFGHQLPLAVFVAIEGALVERWQRLIILGAPLVVVTAGFIIAGFLAEGWVASLLFTGALCNILVATGDVYQIVKTLKQPSKTLFYYPEESGPIVTYELAESSPSLLTRLERQTESIIGPSPSAQTDTKRRHRPQ